MYLLQVYPSTSSVVWKLWDKVQCCVVFFYQGEPKIHLVFLELKKDRSAKALMQPFSGSHSTLTVYYFPLWSCLPCPWHVESISHCLSDPMVQKIWLQSFVLFPSFFVLTRHRRQWVMEIAFTPTHTLPFKTGRQSNIPQRNRVPSLCLWWEHQAYFRLACWSLQTLHSLQRQKYKHNFCATVMHVFFIHSHHASTRWYVN